MAKETKITKKDQIKEVPPRLMIRVDYVGIIAIACLIIGAMVGSNMGGAKSTPEAASSSQAQSATAPMTQQTPPDPEMIRQMMQQISSVRDHDALVNMGNAAMDQHITPVAVAAYEKALSIEPNDPNVLTDLGAVYRDQMEKPQKALELFKKAAGLDPKHVHSRYNLGLIAMHDLKDYKAAEKAFSEVIAMAPDSEQAHKAEHYLAEMKK